MAKGLVDPKMQERHSNLYQFEKGYRQALLDVETWVDEANGDLDFVMYRIQCAHERKTHE